MALINIRAAFVAVAVLVVALSIIVLLLFAADTVLGSDIPEETSQPCIWIYDESECATPVAGTVTPPTPVWYEEEIVQLPATGSGPLHG